MLAPRDGAVYVDATFGAGGYSRALCWTPPIALSGASTAIPTPPQQATRWRHDFGNRLTVLNGRFGDMQSLLAGVGVHQVDGIALDIGVSSMQIDDPARGFSFRSDGPLDMRMGQDGLSAADAVNRLAEKELADIIYPLRRRARVPQDCARHRRAREQSPITRTGQLGQCRAQCGPAFKGWHRSGDAHLSGAPDLRQR